MSHRNFTAAVKGAAFGQWPFILQQLVGLTDLQVDTRTRSTGTACPHCGGHDRYSFKSADNGDWACRHCSGGDGFDLLMKCHGWSFPEAVNRVAGLLGVSQEDTEEQTRLLKKLNSGVVRMNNRPGRRSWSWHSNISARLLMRCTGGTIHTRLARITRTWSPGICHRSTCASGSTRTMATVCWCPWSMRRGSL